MKSDTIGKIAEALAKAQGAIKGAIKDSNNPFFKASYADLASVWDACREQLSVNGLAVTQVTQMNEVGDVVIVTILMHSSGEWVSGELLLKPIKYDPQSIGSAITYARRYALSAIVGIAPEDDDGEKAQGRQDSVPPPHQPQRKSSQPPPKQSEGNPFLDEHEGLTIKEVKVKTGTRNGKHWSKYDIITSDGVIYSTFSDTLGKRAQEAMATGAVVEVTGKESQYGHDLTELSIVGNPINTDVAGWSMEKIVGIISSSQNLDVLDNNWKSLLPHIGKLDAEGKAECQKAYNTIKECVEGGVPF